MDEYVLVAAHTAVKMRVPCSPQMFGQRWMGRHHVIIVNELYCDVKKKKKDDRRNTFEVRKTSRLN